MYKLLRDDKNTINLEDELERMIADEDYSNLWRVPMSIGAPRNHNIFI